MAYKVALALVTRAVPVEFPPSHVTERRGGSSRDEDILVKMGAVNWNRVQ